MSTNDSEIRDFLAARKAAQESKDIDKLMACYADGIEYYDAVAPLRFVGAVEVRRNFLRWFDGYEGGIDLRTHDRVIVTDGDVAFANMLHRDSGRRKAPLQASVWVRETTCLRRVDGAWRITHEHVSIPIDPTTMRPWLPADKDQTP
ncbi:MAG TPA: nuclear transport factor 2 family protein [Stackebrandtia sp.]|uniref:YybH family protein n=1 Tax=Stackebrandtia sp. TaxID=2023065 RepID=UPI002D3EB4C1|nr:nuclear transport factor 2 family protein [Stackebrandtia sp.]HZE39159.1 nuclear transport factor 2 family protein [Stackebrandtia sp.]